MVALQEPTSLHNSIQDARRLEQLDEKKPKDTFPELAFFRVLEGQPACRDVLSVDDVSRSTVPSETR